MLGLVFAFVGVLCSHLLEMPAFDGGASIAIGVLLCGVAVFLAHESRGLLVGEAVDPRIRRSLRDIAGAEDKVCKVGRLLTMHLGPRDVLLALELQFERGLSANDAAKAIERIDGEIRRRHAEVRHIFIETQSRAA